MLRKLYKKIYFEETSHKNFFLLIFAEEYKYPIEVSVEANQDGRMTA